MGHRLGLSLILSPCRLVVKKGQGMKTKQKYDLVKQWKRNRLSLIAIIAFTVINIFIFILQVLGINFKFFSPYSIYLTHFMMQVGYSKSELSGVYMNFMYSVIASMVLVGIFVFL